VPLSVAKSSGQAIVQEPLAPTPSSLLWVVPWAHYVVLMEKVKDLTTRRWYMEQALANGWSRNILTLQIEARTHDRQGKVVSNFAGMLRQCHWAGVPRPSFPASSQVRSIAVSVQYP